MAGIKPFLSQARVKACPAGTRWHFRLGLIRFKDKTFGTTIKKIVPRWSVNILLILQRIKTNAMNSVIGDKEAVKSQKMEIYSDDRIALIENFRNVDMQEAVRLDFILIVLCLQGQGSLYINGKQFHIKANNLLICQPNLILEKSNMSLDIEFRCVALSKEYFQQFTMVGGSDSWDVIKFLEKSPVLPLRPEEVKAFCQYYDLIRSKMIGKPRRYQKELIDALLMAFLYEFRDMLDRFHAVKPQIYSAGGRVFHDFMELLTGSYPKPRNVSYYANKLCITPKYLSSVCKETSGHTASALINHYVLNDIQLLLKRHDKSIKEVCNELDFPNLSFFGRYVKKHLGTSPKVWRKQNL